MKKARNAFRAFLLLLDREDHFHACTLRDVALCNRNSAGSRCRHFHHRGRKATAAIQIFGDQQHLAQRDTCCGGIKLALAPRVQNCTLARLILSRLRINQPKSEAGKRIRPIARNFIQNLAQLAGSLRVRIEHRARNAILDQSGKPAAADLCRAGNRTVIAQQGYDFGNGENAEADDDEEYEEEDEGEEVDEDDEEYEYEEEEDDEVFFFLLLDCDRPDLSLLSLLRVFDLPCWFDFGFLNCDLWLEDDDLRSPRCAYRTLGRRVWSA